MVQPWSKAAKGIAPCDLTCVLGEKMKGTYGSMKLLFITYCILCNKMTLEVLVGMFAYKEAFRCLSSSVVGRRYLKYVNSLQ